MLRNLIGGILFVALFVGSVHGDVVYQIDDGTAEFTLGIDPGEDMVWLNSFPVEPGGEVITSISAAFGRPGLGQVLNGLSITALLYEDLNGGSPQDAVLRQQTAGIVANAHTNLLTEYAIPPTEVHGTLIAALLFRNTTNELKFIGSIDRTAPTLSDRSYAGFAVGLNETNLASIPAGQFRTLAGFNVDGNLIVRGLGRPVPEPSGATVLALSALLGCHAVRRLRACHLTTRSCC